MYIYFLLNHRTHSASAKFTRVLNVDFRILLQELVIGKNNGFILLAGLQCRKSIRFNKISSGISQRFSFGFHLTWIDSGEKWFG